MKKKEKRAADIQAFLDVKLTEVLLTYPQELKMSRHIRGMRNKRALTPWVSAPENYQPKAESDECSFVSEPTLRKISELE